MTVKDGSYFEKYTRIMILRRNIFINENGSAIITVIVFITIALLFINSIILYQHKQSKMILSYGHDVQVSYNTISVLPPALIDFQKQIHQNNFNRGQFSYSLFDRDTTTAIVKPWGLYLLCKTTSKIKKSYDHREFLVGIEPPDIYNYAFVLGNTRFPVNITGNASITGDVYVGLKGIKPGILKGIRFKGANTVNGRIIRENVSHLPSLDLNILDWQVSDIRKSTKISIPEFSDDSKQRLSLNDGIYFITQNDINRMKNIGIRKIIGPGAFISDTELKFSDLKLLNSIGIYNEKKSVSFTSITAENILVFADNISIIGKGNMSGQFYAYSSITLENGIQMVYPSIVGLICSGKKSENHLMTIGENVSIEGALFLSHLTQSEKNKTSDRIIVAKTANIKGFIYSDSYLELYGTVIGSVFAESLYLYSKPTTYINWLKDATINRVAYKQKQIYPLIFNNNLNLQIIREL